MLHAIRNLVVDENGAVLVEYGLLLAIIAVGTIAVLTTMGTSIKTMFSRAATDL